MPRLQPEEIEELRRRYEADEPLGELARQFGIEYNHAYKLVSYDAANSAAISSQRRLREWRRDAKAEMERYGRVSEPLFFGEEAPTPPPPLADQVAALASEGLDARAIATALEQPYHTVWQALKRRKAHPAPPDDEATAPTPTEESSDA